MSNVVSIFANRAKPEPKVVPQDINGVLLAITNWAESNGVDVYSDLRFKYRLADFMALMQITATEKRDAA